MSGPNSAPGRRRRVPDAAPLLSRYCVVRSARGALLLGYAAMDERAIRSGVGRLARALGASR